MANTYIKNDHNSDVSQGLVGNQEVWFKFGECEIDNSLTTIWSGATSRQPGLYSYPDEATPGIPQQMEIISTNNADTGQIVKINGLDKHWKLQSEEITLDGTTPVLTQYEYLRVFRMSVIIGEGLIGECLLRAIGGGLLYAHIEDSGLQINQTQMAIYSVPAGHSILLKKVVCTKADSDPVKIYSSKREIGLYGHNTPFRVVLNWNVDQVGFTDERPWPFLIKEMTDFEARGIALGNRTSDIAFNYYGELNRINSVPIDITGATFTPIVGGVDIAWDEQTPSETSDFREFRITWHRSSDEHTTINKHSIRQRDASSYTLEGLESGIEYEVGITWIGYDGRESSIVKQDVTVI